MRLIWWLRNRGIWLSWQNTNERHGRSGSMLKHGRAWLRLWRGQSNAEQQMFGAEIAWQFGTLRWLGAGIEFGGRGDEERVLVRLHPPFASLWFSIDRGWPKWLIPNRTRELSLTSYHGDGQGLDAHVQWRLWADPDEYGNQRGWRQGGFFLLTPILGSARYSKRVIAEEEVRIPLPEGPLPATVTLYEATWKRPRWPWPERRGMAEVDAGDGAVIPGKGENSWDIDDDAILSLSTQADTVEQAVAKYVESVLRTRRRHGGKDWQPRAVSVA